MQKTASGPRASKPFMLDPVEAAQLRAAYDAALLIASDAGSPLAEWDDDELRQRLARLIVLAAREGITDVDLLKARALRTFHAC